MTYSGKRRVIALCVGAAVGFGSTAATASPDGDPLRASSIPLAPDPEGVDSCKPELAALAMMERMAQLMGEDADVLADAEEDLRSQAADCLENDDNPTELSSIAVRQSPR